MKLSRIYDIAFRTLIVLLPFTIFISVFTTYKLGIPGLGFIKEFLLFVMFMILLIDHIQQRKMLTWTGYDILIFAYIALFSLITIFTTGFSGLIYGGRYDFEFLIAFFIIYHGYSFLAERPAYYIRLFLISSGIMLFLSMLLKWPLSEDILLFFGYSGNPSNWQFGASVPIFHGVDGANVRRFQGILDGPNMMGAYLLLYIGMLVYYVRHHRAWHFFIGCIVIVLIACIVYTYSRSALLGLIGGVGIIILFSLKFLYKKYRTQTISLCIISLLGVGAILLQYGGNIQAIIERGGSSKGHAERMLHGIERVQSHPLGQGLGSAGPGYRYVNDLSVLDRSKIEELDRENIPESWYIQQFIEGGILGGIIFLLLMFLFFLGLYRVHIILAGMFLSILIMNFFLHTFESSVLSLSLFTLMGLILASSHPSRHHV